MSCSRTSRPAAFVLFILAATALTFGAGCKDELSEPTLAEVTLRFVSDSPGAARGANVWLDGEPLALDIQEETLATVLSEGTHTIVVRKDCASVSPAETLRVEIDGGHPAAFEWRIGLLTGLQVTSTPSGLPVYLDGAPTALVTPASFGCLPPGTYDVRVRPSAGGLVGFDAIGDSVAIVTLETQPREVHFNFGFVARSQQRGVLIELFTATYCPNCPPADEAVDVLDVDSEFQRDWVSGVQLHVFWGGTDPLYNEFIDRRLTYYDLEGNSAPHALFNGGQKITGSNLPDVEAAYRDRVRLTYGEAAKAGLYWINPRVEGTTILGTLRFVAIEDLTSHGELELFAFYGKDSLTLDTNHNPFHLERIQGARSYTDAVPLSGDDLVSVHHRDIDVSFDYTQDAIPGWAHWESKSLRLAGFVQDPQTKEILQVREIRLRAS